MKQLVLIAALMLAGASAYADSDRGRDSDFAYRHDGYSYQKTDTNQRSDASNRQADTSNHQRDASRHSARSRDYLQVADRDRDNARDDRSRDHARDAGRVQDHRWDRPRSPAYYRPPIGHYERRLPDRRIVIRVRRHPYYYYGGTFYDYYNGGYYIVNAPVGALVPMLPGGYISFGIGPTRYFYFGGTYYIRSGSQYEVVEPPANAQQIVNTAQEEMIIYPAKGQSQEQLDKDRYECHRWAVDQTGFDPSSNDPNLSLKPDYNRAMGACLEARGYVVK